MSKLNKFIDMLFVGIGIIAILAFIALLAMRLG